MRVSYAQLTDLTGMAYRTIKKRFDDAGLKPAGQADGPGGANLWDSKKALQAIFAPMVEQGLDPQREKALLDREKRLNQEMKNKELAGDLVDKETVSREFFNAGRQVRDALLSIPGRLQASLAATSDIDEVGRALRAEIVTALTALAEQEKGE